MEGGIVREARRRVEMYGDKLVPVGQREVGLISESQMERRLFPELSEECSEEGNQ